MLYNKCASIGVFYQHWCINFLMYYISLYSISSYRKAIQFYAIKLKGSYRKVLCIPYAKVKGSYALVSIKKQRNTKSLC